MYCVYLYRVYSIRKKIISSMYYSLCFFHVLGVNVPRSRFLPVKKSQDLLVTMSNLYNLRNGTLDMSPQRSFPAVPLVKLGSHFNKVNCIVLYVC